MVYFINYVAGAVRVMQQQDSILQNVLYAASLFETLRLYGITYVTVPATSFAIV